MSSTRFIEALIAIAAVAGYVIAVTHGSLL